MKLFSIIICSLLLVTFNCDDDLPKCSDKTVKKDPLLGNQWHIHTDGSRIEPGRAAPAENAHASVKDAWRTGCLGQGITIAVIDDGVDANHVDLENRLVIAPGTNFNDGDADNPAAQAANGDFHGTAVAGIIAAADNGRGVVGIAPRAKILPIRLIAGEISPADEAAAIIQAADLGADVISNSWGPPDDGGTYPIPDIVDAAIWHAATEGRGGKGASITWAAGNGAELISTDGYASHPAVIAVGATTDQNNRAWYSDYGPEVFISAPSNGGANGIWTTDLSGAAGYKSAALPIGDYTIEVIAYTDGSAQYENNYGNYSLIIGDNTAGQSYTETQDMGNEAIAVEAPVTISGSIDEAGESDFFVFTFPGGAGYPIKLETASSLDFDFVIYDAEGVAVTSQNAVGNDYFETQSGDGNYTGSFGGTSAATPMVSGVIAMLYTYRPQLTRSQVRTILKNSASKSTVDDSSWPFISGRSRAYGYGKLDAYAALAEAAGVDHEPNESLAASAQEPGNKGQLEPLQRQIRSNSSHTNSAKQRRAFAYPGQLNSMYFRRGKPVLLFKNERAAIPQSKRLQAQLQNGRVQAYQTTAGQDVYVGSEVNVGLFSRLNIVERQDLWQSYGLVEKKQIGPTLFLLEIADGHTDVFGAAQDLLANNQVRFAAPNMSRLLKKR